MSKKVTIPTDGGNPFVVILGGIKYVYKPGETVDVPDGVALEIKEWERWKDKYHGAVQPPFAAGGGGVQPDLSQNDPAAADYVKNRTHYEEVEYGVIVESETVEVNDSFAELVGVKAMPTENKTYIVILNGTQYECVAWWHSSWNGIILGNGALAEAEGMGEDVPFYIDFYPEDTVYLNVAEAGHYTISVEGEVEIVHKLDPKFLPDGYPYTEGGLLTVLPEQTEFMIDDNRTGYYKTECVLDPDKQYVIDINGTQYDAQVSFDTNYNDGFKFVVETSDIGTVDVFSPFFMVVDDGYSVEDLRSIAIYENGEVVHKLDKKYLPDDIGGGSIMYCGGNNDDDDVHLFHVDFDTGEIGAAVTREELVAAIKHGAIYIALIDEYSVSYKLATVVYFGDNDGYIGTSDEEYFHTAEFDQSSGPV